MGEKDMLGAANHRESMLYILNLYTKSFGNVVCLIGDNGNINARFYTFLPSIDRMHMPLLQPYCRLNYQRSWAIARKVQHPHVQVKKPTSFI